MKKKINDLPKSASEISHSTSKYFKTGELDFSDTAHQMTALKAAIFSSQESHAMKIQFIKEELAAGRYEVHHQRIADSLLEYSKQTIEIEETEFA